MIPTRFDALVRSLISSVSRRDALVGLAMGLAAPLLPGYTAEARRRRGSREGRRMGGGDGRSGAAELGVEKKKSKKKKKKSPPCIPACAGKACGGDGCGGTCGPCGGGQTCQNGNCAATCAPSCAGGRNCGPDDCGGSCGTCGGVGATCGGGGTPGVCGCTPLNACPIGHNCGSVLDGCGGSVPCGSCTAPQTCGGGGTTGVCGNSGCVPNCHNPNGTPRNCGDDGCGGSCGPCAGDNFACEPIFGFCGCRIDNDIAMCESGVCTDLQSSAEHCGRCNSPCNPPLRCCDGRCSSDRYNCSACGDACPQGPFGPPHVPYACCDGACIDEYRCPGT